MTCGRRKVPHPYCNAAISLTYQTSDASRLEGVSLTWYAKHTVRGTMWVEALTWPSTGMEAIMEVVVSNYTTQDVCK